MHKNLHLLRTLRIWKLSIVQGMQYTSHPHYFTQGRRLGKQNPTCGIIACGT